MDVFDVQILHCPGYSWFLKTVFFLKSRIQKKDKKTLHGEAAPNKVYRDW